jgi:catechol 2,3-dioxygenase-like lactoylglutathione lyase family enzyme
MLSLHNVLVFAPDVGAARAFYAGVLGLELERTTDDFLVLRGANFRLIIFACSRPTDPSGYSEQAGSAIVFAVPSLEVAVASLRANGARVLHSTPNEGPLGRYVAFADPFGTVHELVEQRAA